MAAVEPLAANRAPAHDAERVAHLEREVKDLAQRLHDLETECRARLPEPKWELRHRLKWALGVRLSALYHHAPRPLRVPARYHRLPVLKDPPLISIVTPSFGQACFLEQTLRSVLDQDYPRLQYVVQDGGSQDGSVDLLRTYDRRLFAWESCPDRGQGHAINLGFARTSGEIMAYLNADDILMPGSLHYVAHYFREHPEVNVVYGHRIVVNADGDEIGRWVLPPHDDQILRWVDFVPQETLFWRRSAWERAGGTIDESFRFALDWDLLLRLQAAGARFVRLPRFLGAFRVHEFQKTSSQMRTIGANEMKQLRERCHGRDVTAAEIRDATASYQLRSAWHYRMHQLGLLQY